MTLRVKFAVLLFLSGILYLAPAKAQEDTSGLDAIEEKFEPKQKKFYMSNGLDAAIFSTSIRTRPGKDGLSTLRFSYFLNFGFNFNYDFNNAIGLYTGIGIKNIGYIDKIASADSTVKRRVYALGVPLGIKLGNIKRRNYIMLGGGADLALNYREKGYIRRGNKDKFNEWFSDRTPLIMPYVFVGGSFSPGIALKLQYYPDNFMNADYTESVNVSGVSVPVRPYAGYNVNMILLSIGMDIHYKHSGTPKAMLTNSGIAAL